MPEIDDVAVTTAEDLELDDLAAEPDDEPDADELADSAAEGAQDAEADYTVSGLCTGGPWDKCKVGVRFPGGFVLVHKPTARVWLYDRITNAVPGAALFVCRPGSPFTLDEDKLWDAAESMDFDVRVLDGDASIEGHASAAEGVTP